MFHTTIEVSSLFSSTTYGLAATIFYKKSFRKEEIPVVFSLVLSGVLTDIIRTQITPELSVGEGEAAATDFNFKFLFAWSSLIMVIIWTLYLCYQHHQLFRRTIWTSVFLAYLFAILDVRGGLGTRFWASTSQRPPEHFAPTWNVYRVCISAGIQFIRNPIWLKAQLQGMRAKFGPIYILSLTYYMVAAVTVDKHPIMVLISVAAMVLASVAGIILRPDNAAVLEAMGITTTHPERRWYHGRMMGASIILLGVITYMDFSQIELCLQNKECF